LLNSQSMKLSCGCGLSFPYFPSALCAVPLLLTDHVPTFFSLIQWCVLIVLSTVKKPMGLGKETSQDPGTPDPNSMATAPANRRQFGKGILISILFIQPVHTEHRQQRTLAKLWKLLSSIIYDQSPQKSGD
jgi:hypothetical protein